MEDKKSKSIKISFTILFLTITIYLLDINPADRDLYAGIELSW